jgi:hypothetical protein
MAAERNDPVVGYNSYADFVLQKYGQKGRKGWNWCIGYNESSWLVQFLRQGYSKGSGRSVESTEIYIINSINGTLGSSSFTAHRKTPVEPAFLENLRNSPSQKRTRLIMLQCSDIKDVNELYIDAIGLRYRLDPHFFGLL